MLCLLKSGWIEASMAEELELEDVDYDDWELEDDLDTGGPYNDVFGATVLLFRWTKHVGHRLCHAAQCLVLFADPVSSFAAAWQFS